jgi:hypothetical protein
MFKRVLLAMFVTVLICGASLCYSAELRNPPVAKQVQAKQLDSAGIKVPPGLLQKLQSRLSRQTLVGALLANPTTRSAVEDGIAQSGGSKTQMSTLANTPLVQKASTVAAAALPGDVQFSKLDWTAGFTFTPFKVPTYGTGNWRLGVVWVDNAALRTNVPDAAIINTYTQYNYLTPIRLLMELPQEPALYTVTLRLVRQDGKCFSSWVVRNGSNTVAPIRATLLQFDDSPLYWTEEPIPMTMLPDGTGMLGVMNAAPAYSRDGSEYGMRRYTALIEVTLFPNAVRSGEGFGNLLFSGITITRL